MTISRVEQKIAEIRVMLKKTGLFYSQNQEFMGDKVYALGSKSSYDSFVKGELKCRVEDIRKKLFELEVAMEI